MNWKRKKVLVTGAAGFIGHHLIDKLLSKSAIVTGIDKMHYGGNILWDTKLKTYMNIWKKHGFKPKNTEYDDGATPLIVMDLEKDREKLENLINGFDIVFHLSAVFGGRGFVDTRQAECCAGFAINHNVIAASYNAGVKHLNFASSACVYPIKLQEIGSNPLKEEDSLSIGDGWESSDNTYGWVKLMAELELKAYYEQFGFNSSVCRYLTVYGPQEYDESHAIATLIRKALRKDEPYVVWGTGEQERGFTYVDDIVDGSILCAEKIKDALPLNLGWSKKYKIKDVVNIILELTGHQPKKLVYDISKPEGPKSRSLDVQKAKRLLNWEPKIDIREGLVKTINWAKEAYSRGEIS
jgi:nucleoside-diphosphate-sugar epimerase